MQINTGIPEADREKVVKGLSHFLADTYLLYLKTQNFHWNVTGPDFYFLHKMFEEQYEALAEAADEIAERIRALGYLAPASFVEFSKLATLKETAKHGLDGQAMVAQLLADHESVVRSARGIFDFADEVDDEATADLMVKRLDAHEKTAWMLRSSLR